MSSEADDPVRIRVLRVIAGMNVGGPARQVTALARGLDPDRYDHRLVVGEVDDAADELEMHADHLDVRRVGSLGGQVRPAGDVGAFRAISAQVRSFGPHIVHTHTAKAGTLGRLAAIRSRVPHVVHTYHGHLLHGHFNPAITAAITQVERSLSPHTSVLVAVDARVRDDLLEAGVGRPEQYVVVAPGIHLPDPPPREEARADLALAQDVPVVAYVGRITGVKRPDRLVDVARQVLASMPHAVFLVAGDGDLEPDTRERAADLGGQVRFLGWRPDVERIYAAADVAVLTSDNEGMPMPLIEAARCGLPAVTPDVGSAAEVVRDGITGFVVSPRVGSISARLTLLLADRSLRHRMGQAAREAARGAYSADRLVADTQAIYERLMSGTSLTRSSSRS